MPTLFLMMGYPGAGKTTTSQVIHQLTGAVHLWADQIRSERFGAPPSYSIQETQALYEYLNQLTDELLSTGQSVIYDTNFNFYRDRQLLRQIAAKQQAEVKLLWIVTPRAVAHHRATQNAHRQGTRILGNMPEGAFDHIANGLEMPHADEDATKVDGTTVTADYIEKLLDLKKVD